MLNLASATANYMKHCHKQRLITLAREHDPDSERPRRDILRPRLSTLRRASAFPGHAAGEMQCGAGM